MITWLEPPAVGVIIKGQEELLPARGCSARQPSNHLHFKHNHSILKWSRIDSFKNPLNIHEYKLPSYYILLEVRLVVIWEIHSVPVCPPSAYTMLVSVWKIPPLMFMLPSVLSRITLLFIFLYNIWAADKAQMLQEGKKNYLKQNSAFLCALKQPFIGKY